MDPKLLAWALRVKPREPRRGRLPRLWLFTDLSRLPDPLAAIALLPRGAAGVVLRPEGMDAGLAGKIAALCRARRLTLSAAGDARLAARLHAGRHWRGGRPPAPGACARPALTGSAHTVTEVLRCRRAGVRLVFVSPVFATASHPGGRALGVRRWAALARLAGGRAAGLGGIDGRTIAALPRDCRAVGAIGAVRRSSPLLSCHSVSQMPCPALAEGCDNVTGAAIVPSRSGCATPRSSPTHRPPRNGTGSATRLPDCPAL